MKKKKWRITFIVLLVVCLVAPGCNPSPEQAQALTQLAILGQTAIAVAKTEGPPLQTQLAQGVKTVVVVAQTEGPPMLTEVAQLVTANAGVTQPAVGDWAELAQQSEYLTVYPEDFIRPYVIVRNAGAKTWQANSYGYSAKGEWTNIWGDGKLWRDVKSGETIEFIDETEIRAPKDTGTYYYGFMLINAQGDEFGPFFYIQVNVVPKPDNVGSSELKLLAKLPVDPLRYYTNKQLSPAGYLDFLQIEGGSVLADLIEIFELLRTGNDILNQPDKIEAAFYEDVLTHACFAQITEYKGDEILKQDELILVPCEAVPIQS